jgi:hypothetical protein
MDNAAVQKENRRPMKMDWKTNRPPSEKIVGRLIVISVALFGLTASRGARAQVAAQPLPPPAPPAAAPGPAAPPDAQPQPPPPPVEPVPGYGYGPPSPYYYYHHRYRPMPYASPYAAPYASPYAAPYASPVAIDPMDGFHTHDGFYMRVHAGISGTGFASTQAGVKTNYVGGGFSSGIAIGGVIAHNLILYGAFFGTDTTNPDKQVAGASVTSDLGEIGVGAIGPGLAYYFERYNIYLSATFGLAGFNANDVNAFRVDTSKSGTALDFMVGKEWWVSHDWGLGIAGELMAASLKDKNVPGLTWSASGLSVLFSATYN